MWKTFLGICGNFKVTFFVVCRQITVLNFHPWKILRSRAFFNLIFSLTRSRTNSSGPPLLGGLGPVGLGLVGLGLGGPVGLGGRGLVGLGGSGRVGLGGGGRVGLGVGGGLVGLGGGGRTGSGGGGAGGAGPRDTGGGEGGPCCSSSSSARTASTGRRGWELGVLRYSQCSLQVLHSFGVLRHLTNKSNV